MNTQDILTRKLGFYLTRQQSVSEETLSKRMKFHELDSINIENITIARDALVSLLFCFSPTNREGNCLYSHCKDYKTEIKSI